MSSVIGTSALIDAYEIGSYEEELLEEVPFIEDEFNRISKIENILFMENRAIADNPATLCDYPIIYLFEANEPNSLPSLLEQKDIKLDCTPKFQPVILLTSNNNKPLTDNSRADDLLKTFQNRNRTHTSQSSTRLPPLTIWPNQFSQLLELISIRRELPRVSMYVEIQIIDPEGKRRPGEILLPNTNYVLRVWLRRRNTTNDVRQLESPIEKSAITNKQIEVVLYSPDKVNIDALSKRIVINSLEELAKKNLPGDFIDYNIKTPDVPVKKSRNERDYLTFSIDMYYRHLMIGWMKLQLPFHYKQ